MIRFLREEIQKILSCFDEGIIITDANRKIQFFNTAAEKITGRPADQAIGRKCADVFQSDHCDSQCKLLAALQEKKKIFAPEVSIRDFNGKTTTIKGQTLPIQFNDGEEGVIQIFSDISEVTHLRKQLYQASTVKTFITQSPYMLKLMSTLPDMAQSDTSILILGETGVGKEILAQTIHNESRRKDKPFIKVNCGALPDNLLEAELFGVMAGAYTDAKKSRKGRLEIADGGTLFLDEIGDMSLSMQVKVLRVLQEKTFEPLGSSKTRKVDVRFISATNQDLSRKMSEKTFRDDLFYRINTMTIRIPPLRNRKEDIPLLVDHFIKKYCYLTDKNIESIDERVMKVFIKNSWKGNVRQLENVIEHAFVLAKGMEIQMNHLPMEFQQDCSAPEIPESAQSPLNSLRQKNEMQMILDSLHKNKWNKVITARELGISRSTLWRKMKEMEIPMCFMDRSPA